MQLRKSLVVFFQFLLLGCTSFGGPAAHIGYFQKTFVEKLGWIDQHAYARLIALSQFLPGPGSSQVGFALGLRYAGLSGAIAAFIGFTLPSFSLMYLLAVYSQAYQESNVLAHAITGLKLLAVVVVADATLTMYQAFCRNNVTILVAFATAVGLLVFPGLWNQVLLLLIAALLGLVFLEHSPQNKPLNLAGIQYVPLIVFSILFMGLPLLGSSSHWLDLFDDFYRAGSLVFGGGHVVLPLLQQSLVDDISSERFLFGYAAAQAVPGPMFTLATYLGAVLATESALTGALVATLAIFLPGFLLVLGLQNAWESLSQQQHVAGATMGINAAVVGLLMMALYQPVFVSAVHDTLDLLLVLLGFFFIRVTKAPLLLLVCGFIIAGILLT